MAIALILAGGFGSENTMMVEQGVGLFCAGSDRNIKMATKDGLEKFKAYLKLYKDNWLK